MEDKNYSIRLINDLFYILLHVKAVYHTLPNAGFQVTAGFK
jgi:hypothetical protein